MRTFIQHWHNVITSKKGNTVEKLFLTLLSYPYRWIMGIRNFAYDCRIIPSHRDRLPVISIGNISVGGSGKTPLALWCAKILLEQNKKPAIVARGYKRNGSERDIRIVSDGEKILETACRAGDEAYLAAKKLKGACVIVGGDRVRSVAVASRLEATHILLDDGFQHRKLKRNLDILCIDPSILEAPYFFPRGILRESLAGMARADFIAIKNGDEQWWNCFEKKFRLTIKKPIGFFAYKNSCIQNHKTGIMQDIDFLRGKKIIPFCGIANPLQFEEQLQRAGAQIAESIRFEDHHPYRENELKVLREKALTDTALLVTTEKDGVKLPRDFPAHVLTIELEWKKGEEKIKELLANLNFLG